uniref:RNA-binding protein n=1 Tax=Geobacter metallireducens TaxID=28232 RepID=A0A831TW78_GEOME
MSMNKELYVGHMSYEATEKDLIRLFSVAGTVTSVHLITDPETGEFKGCGYVRMSSAEEAQEAIETLDGALLRNRPITVSLARPQKQKPGAGRPGKGRPGGSFVGGSRGKSASGTGGSRRAAGPDRAAEGSRGSGGPGTRTAGGSPRAGGPAAGRGKSGPGTGPGEAGRGKSGPAGRSGRGKK